MWNVPEETGVSCVDQNPLAATVMSRSTCVSCPSDESKPGRAGSGNRLLKFAVYVIDPALPGTIAVMDTTTIKAQHRTRPFIGRLLVERDRPGASFASDYM